MPDLDDWDPTPPTLKQIWPEAPHIPGENVKLGGGGGGQNQAPPSHKPYSVSPGSIRDAENTLLQETGRQVEHYESFKNYVNERKEWIFSFASSDTRYTAVPGFRSGSITKDHPVNPDTAHNTLVAQDQGLVAVANVIELAGQFIARLNNSGQSYAMADIASEMPEADTGSNGGNGAPPK
jgi:hypothetical protein